MNKTEAPTTKDGSNNLDDGQGVVGLLSLLGLVIVLTVSLLLIAAFSLCMGCLRRRIISVTWRSMSISIGGWGQRGLDAQTIDAFPVYVYHHENTTENKQPSMENSENFGCAICISEFEENEKVKSLLPCKHSFHADCIDMWLSSHASCPVCRCTVSCNAHGEADSRLSNPEQEEGVVIDVGTASASISRESFSSARLSLSSSMRRMLSFNSRHGNGKEEPSSSVESQPEVRLHVDS